MFPVTEQYIQEECIQTSNKRPVSISEPLANEIIAKQKKTLALIKAGISGLVFTNIISLDSRPRESLDASA